MKKYLSLLIALAVVMLVLARPGHSQSNGRTVKVKLHYTGNGTVDDKHKIFVVLFDSPDFSHGNGAMPLSVQSATGKNETVTFSDVSTSPVYGAASYDPTGNYDGQSGPPPSGASLGMYTKTPPKPEPIQVEPGKTVQVEITFNDTQKMP